MLAMVRITAAAWEEAAPCFGDVVAAA